MNDYIMNTDRSPLDCIDTSFEHYVQRRKNDLGIHMNGSVPDYAFSLDYELRKKMDQIPHFYSVCRKIAATYTTRAMQEMNQQGLLVGPSQYPEIYQMGVDCAHKLGIAIPNIYIKQSNEINAYTTASDDVSPFIVLYTGIIDRMSPGELKCVIAHECGHIHNQHLVYERAISKLLSSGSGNFGMVLALADVALVQMWTRAQEVTADRAAMICADSVEDAVNVDYKLLSGSTYNEAYTQTPDFAALREQLDMTLDNPSRFLEIQFNHPSSLRRIFADMEFEECEVFYSWRPEMKKPGCIMRSKAETDARCQKLVNIWNNK